MEEHPGRIRAGSEQRPDVFLQQRMNHPRRYFSQRFEDKPPLGHARMRNLEAWFVNDPIAKKQDVDIQRPWGSLKCADPPLRGFNREANAKQFLRGKIRCHFQRDIQEPRLLQKADRLGFKHRGDTAHDNPLRAQGLNPRAEVGLPVTEIRSG